MCELLSFSFADTLLVWMCVQVEHSVLEEVSSGGKHTRLNATMMIKKTKQNKARVGACVSCRRIMRRRKKQKANLKDEVGWDQRQVAQF